MEYHQKMNELIETIEKNLENPIDYQELAKKLGTSVYTMQRIFVFLTGITLTEYIRKRRLTKAAEELMTSDIKIIDLSMKYQYDSPVSFSNAFKKMHEISPNLVRKNHPIVKAFQKIHFDAIQDIIQELDYRILELEEQTFYGKTTGLINADFDKEEIRKIYETSRQDGTLNTIIQNSDGKELYYGVSTDFYYNKNESKYRYYILGKKPEKEFEKVVIPKATWACFKVKGKEQKDIIKTFKTVYTKWLPQSRYRGVLNYPELEIYYENDCEICIAIE